MIVREMPQEQITNNQEKLNICVYGGSFNPIHCGHVISCNWVMMTQRIDKLIIVPVYRHQFKSDLIDFEHRVNMVRLAFKIDENDPRVSISDIEKYIGYSRTADTVEALSEQYPNANFSIMIGSDIIHELDRWTRIDDLRNMVSFVVMDREIYAGGVSSTKVREALSTNNQSYLSQVLPIDVNEYIVRHNLYRVK
jgi:nicotinate-nucleotide adenylyltransferase